MDFTTVYTVASPKVEEKQEEAQLILRLRPKQEEEQDGPRVTWAEGVIDNEHLGRLKSNCCCIYTRPRQWDDPTTWEQDEHETEHCRGHTLPPDQEKRLASHKEDDGCHSPCCQ